MTFIRALRSNFSAHRYASHCLFATEYVPYDMDKQSQLSSLPIAYYVQCVMLGILYMHYTTKPDSLMELKCLININSIKWNLGIYVKLDTEI